MSVTDRLEAAGVDGLMATFNRAGLLAAADVHVAARLGQLVGVADDLALLGAAFAVRAPRLGHVCVDLASISETASTDADDDDRVKTLPWPDPSDWLAALREGTLTAPEGPLVLRGSQLYLDRYWSDEQQVAADLLLRARDEADQVDVALLASGVRRLVQGGDPWQRMAAASAVLRRLAVIAGGPGTGKTTTVAVALALLLEQAAARGDRPPRVALAAPTGKAAARLQEAMSEEAERLDVPDEVRAALHRLAGSTLHRLLKPRPGSHTRFVHGRHNRLPHDVVVVDEMSMVPLTLMARLVEAVRPDARLLLVGDHEQLASVEAGAVLGDVVGPAGPELVLRDGARRRLGEVTGTEVEAAQPPGGTPIGDGIVVLRHVHRFAGAIRDLASAIQRGDPDATVRVLGEGSPEVQWLARGEGQPDGDPLRPVRAAAVDSGRRLIEEAAEGRAQAALEILGEFRLLCAHRQGPHGAVAWGRQIADWLGIGPSGDAERGPDWWRPGRPLLVTRNDYTLRLYNGDTGVVVADGDRVVACFEQGGQLVRVSPVRLGAVETVYAMTVHKSQGSQFDTVAVVLPDEGSPILTRQLLYTAVTRARRKVLLVATEQAVRSAVSRPVARSSGLQRALWGVDPLTEVTAR